jgi:hypothetical protein
LVVGSKTNTWKDCLILWLIRACVCLTLILWKAFPYTPKAEKNKCT